MLRTATLGTLTALALGLGVVAAPTAQADLLDLLSPSSSSTAEPGSGAEWGSTRAPDQVLRAGCRNYRFSYRINTPNDEWQAEVFFTDPKGRAIAHKIFDAGSDPRADTRTFRTCRPSTTPGRFKIRMRVAYTEGYERHLAFVDPSFFRLTRPS